MSQTSVLGIGLPAPKPGDPLPPGMPDEPATYEKLAKNINNAANYIRAAGYDADMVFVDSKDEGTLFKLVSALQEKKWDIIVVGAGLRLLPPMLVLFEEVVNIVHEHAPQARICFNQSPETTIDAIQRWDKK